MSVKAKYNYYNICREILDNFGATNWIGKKDIDDYLDIYYNEMNDEDRQWVFDRMNKFADIDYYRSVF